MIHVLVRMCLLAPRSADNPDSPVIPTVPSSPLTSVLGVNVTGRLLALRPALPTGVGTHPKGVTTSMFASSSYL